jgi:ABC-2 type transport system permease protein
MRRFLATYAKVFTIGWQNTFAYRWNFLLRSLFSFVPLIGTVFLWRAIFESQPEGSLATRYNYEQMIFYFLISLLVNLLTVPTDDEWQISADIKDGFINAILLKPIHYFQYRFCLFASYRLVYTLVALGPVLAVLVFFRQTLSWPDDPWMVAAFGISLLLSATLQFLIAYCIALLAFWVQEVSTLVFIVYAFEVFFSGQMFPLDILPPKFVTASRWLPFQYEVFFPVQVFQERLSSSEVIGGLLIALAWVVLGCGIARAVYRTGLNHYTAVGG